LGPAKTSAGETKADQAIAADRDEVKLVAIEALESGPAKNSD
jgi:hypothetical protein